MLKSKPICQSAVTMSHMMLLEHANPAGNVHGGEIMKLMDTAGGVAALRHCRTNVVTARVDELEFHYPVRVGNLITCHAQLTFAGRSSMEASVTVTVEDLFCEEPAKIALTAFFTFVSLDANGQPQPVPALEISTPQEQALFDQGRQRYLNRKQRQQKI